MNAITIYFLLYPNYCCTTLDADDW